MAFVEAEGTRVLVDAGLSKEEIVTRLGAATGATLEEIDAVLVTHDHADHAGCAPALGRPIYTTEGTRQARAWDGTHRVRSGERIPIGALEIHPVLLPHDGVETVGYVLEAAGTRVGILTDCGHDAPDVARAFAGCDVLVLEANHDLVMLRHGPYPNSLRRRVAGRLGHLSNDQAASLVRMMCREAAAPRLVVVAHLSQANNRPQLAKSAIDRALGREVGAGRRVIVASQVRPTPMIVIENGRVSWAPDPLTPELEGDSLPRARQLSFDFAARPRPEPA